MRHLQATLLVVSLGAALCPPAAASDAQVLRDDTFLSKERRYPEVILPLRVLVDLVAVPASVVDWDAGDLARFAAVGVVVGAFLVPAGPSLDVRLDRWFRTSFASFPDVWGFWPQLTLWGSFGLGLAGTWAWALATDREELAEGMSLAIEALSVAEMLHLTLKLLFGREGPEDPGGLGVFRGPLVALSLFPRGFPSGHFATLFAVLAVLTSYWPSDAVMIGGGTVLSVMALTHAMNHRHFVSDQIAGAALGYFVGRWVVKHRSSRGGRAASVSIVPWTEGDATGVAMRWAF